MRLSARVTTYKTQFVSCVALHMHYSVRFASHAYECEVVAGRQPSLIANASAPIALADVELSYGRNMSRKGLSAREVQ